MKVLIVLAVLAALVLTACATPSTPAATSTSAPISANVTPEPAQPTSDGTQIVPTPQEVGLVATLSLGEAVTLVAPGQALLPEATEPVGPDQPAPQFQSLTFTMRRGVEGIDLVITLSADGTLTRDGVVSALPTSETQAVVSALNNLRLYDVVATFTGPAQRDDSNIYGFTLLATSGSERFIPAMEEFTPPQYLRFFNALGQLGLQPFPVF
jgi:hypothetical protein